MDVKHYVRLRVLSETYSADELASQIGMPGDASWRAGDLRKNTAIREKANGWLIESWLDPAADLVDHIADIFARIAGREAGFLALSNGATVELSCAVYVEGRVPPLYFSHEVVSKVAGIGASLDIDLYILSG